MSAFKDKSWITTDSELKDVLIKCDQCWKSTLNGDLIVPFDSVGSFPINQELQAYIINTVEIGLGHWNLLLLRKNSKTAVLFDPLNSLKELSPRVFNHIEKYCKSLRFSLHVLNIKTQGNHSKACGFHIIWMLHKCHDLSINGIYNLIDVLKHHSILHIEKTIVHDVLKTFLH